MAHDSKRNPDPNSPAGSHVGGYFGTNKFKKGTSADSAEVDSSDLKSGNENVKSGDSADKRQP